jgi:hypothetical protein
MTAVSAFIPRIAYRVDGCPEPTIQEAVLDSCIEFCERSQILRQTLDGVTAVANVSEIELDLASGTKAVQVMKVWVDGSEIWPISESEVGDPLVMVDSIPGQDAVTGAPVCFFEPTPVPCA